MYQAASSPLSRVTMVTEPGSLKWAIHNGADLQDNGAKKGYDGARKSMNGANLPVFL